MAELKVGDIVARKSYGQDILFRVVDIKEDKSGKIAVLHGLHYRIEADAPVDDIEMQSENRIKDHHHKFIQKIQRVERSCMMDNRRTIKKNS